MLGIGYICVCSQNDNKECQSIENDFILESFQQAEEKHGLRHRPLELLAMETRSFLQISGKKLVTGWVGEFRKEECTKNVCKCYRSNLKKMVNENPLYKGRHHL